MTVTTTSFGRPGVYIQEQPLPRNIPPQGSTSAVICLIGGANQGPVEPTYVASWREFVSIYGGLQIDTPLQMSAFQAFANGSGPIWVVRITGENAATAKPSTSDSALLDFDYRAASPGDWSNGINIRVTQEIDGLGVLSGLNTVEVFAGTQVPEKFVNLSSDPSSSQYLPAVINGASKYIRVDGPADHTRLLPLNLNVTTNNSGGATLTVNLPDLSAVNATLLGGDDGGPVNVASYSPAFDSLDALEGALLLYAPDASYMGSNGSFVNRDLSDLAATRGDSFAITDTPAGFSVDQALAHASQPTDYAAMYYPHVRVANPSQNAAPGSSILIPPGGSVAGLIITKDREDGPWSTPAGAGMTVPTYNSTRFLGVERLISNDDLNRINTATSPINPLRPITNSGITIMGGRTRTTESALRYISVRRALNYIKLEIRKRAEFALFQPITGQLMESMVVTLGSFLGDVWQRGGLVGANNSDAYFVACDETNNSADTINQGYLYVDVGVALVIPAEYIIVRVGQFEGGTSAAELV